MDDPQDNQDCVLKLKNISKAFPGVQALDRVNLNLHRGMVHALMGENGAGKSTLLRDLSVAQRQMVEIAKALSYDAQIIMMDEPTSALAVREVKRLFAVIRDLRHRGCAICYISHKLDEVFDIADQVTVLRDGQVIGTCRIDQVREDALIRMMVGRELKDVFPARTGRSGAERLSVKDLGGRGVFRDISFSVLGGEILGLAGLMGTGRTELVRSLFGLDPYDSGQIFIGGREVTIQCPRDAIEQGLGLVSEDRQVTGLIPCLGLRHNLTLPHLQQCAQGSFIQRRQENRLSDEQIEELSIKTTSREQPVCPLSGGNQQKVVLGKALIIGVINNGLDLLNVSNELIVNIKEAIETRAQSLDTAVRILRGQPYDRQVFIPFELVTQDNVTQYIRPH